MVYDILIVKPLVDSKKFCYWKELLYYFYEFSDKKAQRLFWYDNIWNIINEEIFWVKEIEFKF